MYLENSGVKLSGLLENDGRNTELFQLPKTRFEKDKSEDDLHAIKKETKWNHGLKETK